MPTVPHPFARPYPNYLDGRWFRCGRSTLLASDLVQHVVFCEEDAPEAPHPTESEVAELLGRYDGEFNWRRLLHYDFAHPFGMSEVYRTSDDQGVLVGVTWGRALSKCDRLTLSTDGRAVLGWFERAGKLRLVAMVALDVLPMVHGWVRTEDESVSATRRRPKETRPSPRHRLLVRDLLDHPWEPVVSAVRLGWAILDQESGVTSYENAGPGAWPFRESVVSMGDLRAAKLLEV